MTIICSVNLIHGTALLPSLGFGFANLLEVMAAFRLVQGIPGGTAFLGNLKGTLRFFSWVTLASASIAALVGGLTATVFFGGGFPRHFITWLLVDAAGLAVVMPAILAWMHIEFKWERRKWMVGEFAACTLIALFLTYVVFASPTRLWTILGQPLPYVIMPLLVWAGLRFGARGASTVHLCVYIVAAWYTSLGHGPFVLSGDPKTSLLVSMHLFPYAVAFCSMVPAVLFHTQGRTEAILRMRESRYGNLWNSKLIGIFVSDMQGVIREANDAFLAMVGYSRSEMDLGDIQMFKMCTPEYLATVKEKAEKFQRDGQIGPYERQWILKDGRSFESLTYGSKMEEADLGLGMVMDIGELKKTKQELRFVESRFKNMFDSNIIGVAVVNRDQVFEEANDAYLRLTGYDRGDLEAGMITAKMLQVPGHEAGYTHVEKTVQAKGKMDPQEAVYLRKDGSWKAVFRGVAVLEDSGSYLIVAIDLTELKETQAALQVAKSAAEAANIAKSDFLAHMSHEIRTPLNGVMGMMSLLLGTDLTPEQRSYAKVSKESGEHLLSLINQILDFSKIESGHFDLDSSPFSLIAIVEGTFASVMEKAQKKNLEIVTKLDPELPTRFLGDPVRLQQILLNLIGNAVKFSERGDVRLSVSLLERKDSHCRILFEVADNGPGISQETILKLFQPFRQGDDALSRQAGGTGLGLAISKDLVGRMGGEIWVESQLMEGSRFAFTVRLEIAEDEEKPFQSHEGEEKKPLIWIVESHPQHSQQLKEILSGWGFATRITSNDLEMMISVEKFILSDQPPAMAILSAPFTKTGLELGTRILASSRMTGVPVLCTLPFISQAQGPSLLRSGAAGIITKPFRISEIYNSILSILPGWEGGREAAAQNTINRAIQFPVMDWKSSPRILVVDDHPVNLTVASAMLSKLGCTVETVPDGNSAISATLGKPFDLVFMDCQMPLMDGFETTRKLRALEEDSRQMTIVALTAHAVAGFREKCLSEGMDDYISKPFTVEEISRVLRKWIGTGSEIGSGLENTAALPSPAKANEEIVDRTRLTALDDGSPQGGERVRKLAHLFIETTKTTLESIHRCQQESRGEDLSKALHKLKGGCGTIGARAMFTLLQTMEVQIESGHAKTMPALIGKLEAAFSQTKESLRLQGWV